MRYVRFPPKNEEESRVVLLAGHDRDEAPRVTAETSIYELNPYPFSVDCFTITLSFLSGKDKVKVALICKAWKTLVYSPELWPVLDLSSYSSAVHNLLLEHVLNKYAVRFTKLLVLRLEGCQALRSGCMNIITENCPDLEVLLLTGCSRIHHKAVVAAIPYLPKLEKLELFGVTEDFSVAEYLRRTYPWLDLGMFWLQYLASIGKEDPLMIMNGPSGARMRYPREVDFSDDIPEPREAKVDNFQIYEEEIKAPDLESLYGPPLASRDFQFGRIIPEIRERLEEGPPALKDASCRYAGGFVGGCWEQVKGRVIYSNQSYSRGGNYPREVLYSCQEHRDEDFKDENLHWCRACERFTRESSFFGEMTCKVCHDENNLQNTEIWVPLTTTGIKNFDFNHILSHTLTIADHRNLPATLKRYGTVRCTLDLTFEGENGDDIDFSEAPIKTFWEVNSQKIRLQVHNIKKRLERAKKRKETRAFLLYRGTSTIEVHADKGLLFDGPEGQDYVNLTIQAWGEFYNIIGPIVGTLIAVLLFLGEITELTNGVTLVQSAPVKLPDEPKPKPSTEIYIILIVLVSMFLSMFCLIRFREWCQMVFRSFVVVDIFMILALGVGILSMGTASILGLNTDKISILAVSCNFGIVGLLTFYKPVAEALHRGFLVLLFGLMAIITSSVLGWYVLLFVVMLTGLDFLVMIRPRFASFLTPFLLPTNFQVPNTTPRIFYEVNGLRLRATDFIFYGQMASIATSSIVDVSVGYIYILVGCTLCIYVLPFFSKKLRPLPIAFIFMLLSLSMVDQILRPYLSHEAMRWSLMHP